MNKKQRDEKEDQVIIVPSLPKRKKYFLIFQNRKEAQVDDRARNDSYDYIEEDEILSILSTLSVTDTTIASSIWRY